MYADIPTRRPSARTLLTCSLDEAKDAIAFGSLPDREGVPSQVMDSNRRTILASGAAATAMAAAPRVFAQQTEQEGAPMSFYEKGPVRIHFQEAGSGFPLLLIAGGGLNSTISNFTRNSPFNPIEELRDEYRCIAADLRNAASGQSTGPLEIERPWEMDHLGIDKFMVLGFCIGGPVHLESVEAGTGSYCCGSAGPAKRVASGDARLFLRKQYEDVGSRAVKAPARPHDGGHRKISDKDVPQ
jgi:hypothetical protein